MLEARPAYPPKWSVRTACGVGVGMAFTWINSIESCTEYLYKYTWPSAFPTEGQIEHNYNPPIFQLWQPNCTRIGRGQSAASWPHPHDSRTLGAAESIDYAYNK